MKTTIGTIARTIAGTTATGRSLAILALLQAMSCAALAADSPKLAAPVYPGAVPAVLASGVQADPAVTGSFGGVTVLDCGGTRVQGGAVGPWCFLSRDPVDKVKAFYEKAVGPMRPVNGTIRGADNGAVRAYAVIAERAWFPGEGESSAPGFDYAAVSLHTMPPPGAPAPAVANTDDTWAGQEAYAFYAGTRHFNGFIDAVDWFGDPTKRKPAELDAYYAKHKQLESALFQHKGPELEPVDETLREQYSEVRKQKQQQAIGMMPGQGQFSDAQIAQMQQAAQSGQMPPGMMANQQGTPEDDEFTAFMQKNPAVAARYSELSQQLNTLMQQGKFDEADEVDMELTALIDANPELAALENRANQRSTAAAAAGQAQENQAMANYGQGMDQAVWGTWQDYIAAAEKEACYTLIVIDQGFSSDAKDYSRDQGLIASETGDWMPHQQVWGFSYPAQGSMNASAPASAPDTSDAPTDEEDKVTDTVKKGWNKLKKVF